MMDDETKKQFDRLRERFTQQNLCTVMVSDGGISGSLKQLCGKPLPCPIHGGERVEQEIDEMSCPNASMSNECGPWLTLARIYDEIANSISVNMLDTETASAARRKAADCYKQVYAQVWISDEAGELEGDDDEA